MTTSIKTYGTKAAAIRASRADQMATGDVLKTGDGPTNSRMAAAPSALWPRRILVGAESS